MHGLSGVATGGDGRANRWADRRSLMSAMNSESESSVPKRRWFQYRLRSLLLVMLLLALYLATWVGGARRHARELQIRAQRHWTEASARNQEMAPDAATLGLNYVPQQLRQGGPATRVEWSFPLLPGILITKSEYVIAPLWGKGGVKLVLFYGIDSVEVVTLWGWRS